MLLIARDEEVNFGRNGDFQKREVIRVWKPRSNRLGCYLQAFLLDLCEEGFNLS